MYITRTYVILISVFSVGRPRVYILNNGNTHMCMQTCAHMSHICTYARLCRFVCVFVCPSVCIRAHLGMCAHMHLCMHVCITIIKK